MASSNDNIGNNGAPNNSNNGTLTRSFTNSRDYNALLQQYDKTNVDLNNSRWRCDHGLSDLDYYREQHRAAMNQLEVSSQDSASLRIKYSELLADKQRLENENQRLRQELDSGNGNADKLFLSHSQALSKLELAQDENSRLLKQCDLMGQERQSLQRQVAELKSQVNKIHKDYKIYREVHQKLQQQYDDSEKQLLAVRIKANKDLKRLTDERNATMNEYTLVMSERDTVHKEMEKLSDDLAQSLKKNKTLDAENKQLQQEKQALNYQLESLRREIGSALLERDKAMKQCSDLRERFGDIGAKSKEDSRDIQGSHLLDSLLVGENSARKDLLLLRHDSRSISQRQRLDNIDQANQELESLRKNLDKVQSELNEAINEAEVCKGRRDWAFSERDRIVLERESFRTLCDNMRKERDRAVSELAEALRESDAVKKQRNELLKEVKMLKELLEEHQDAQQSDTELLDIDLSGGLGSDLGLSLVGGRDDPIRPGDTTVYVAAVAKGSIADGKLRPDDCISRVNDVDCASVSRRMVLEAIRSSLPQARVVVRRRKNVPVRWIHTGRLAPACHGLTLKAGVYIARISEGSLAARDRSLAVGDRVLRINDFCVEEINNIQTAIDALNDDTADVLTITTLKIGSSESPNVFVPVRKYRRENRSSQTEEPDNYNENKYSGSNSGGGSSSSSAWLRDKFDLMRGRRHSKEKCRTNSPNPEQAIAELDLVLDSYHGTNNNTGTVKRSKPKHKEDKNGGTWPKARSHAVFQTGASSGGPMSGAGTTVVRPKKERAPLSLLIDTNNKPCCNNRNSTPLPLPMSPAPRYAVYRSLDGGATDDSLEKFKSAHPHRHSHNLDLKEPLAPYYRKMFTKPELEAWSRLHHPFQPHPHQNSLPPPLPPHHNISRESFSFEPPGWHGHSSSTDYGSYLRYQQRGMVSPGMLQPHHPHHTLELLDTGSGTFPRNQRFRVPSNPSVVSGKLSTGSIERGIMAGSERGSPAPIFHVEVLSPGPGELRRVHIDKSNEPLGIQINCPDTGGIFVSTVNEGSLASRVGLQIGDQLLEVCGINMRNATYNLAANVLRQCGNSITMLVQYSPDKYSELSSCPSSDDEPSGDSPHDQDDATPCNSPKEVRKLQNCLPSQLAQQEEAPRFLYMETMKSSNLGISLVGGNAAGIFIHSVQPDSIAFHAGLRTGDQILEYNGSDLRHATAEEAAYELAKPADKVTVLAQQRMARYNEIKDKPGDSLYVRCGFDRSGNELTDPPELSFSKDDVLYVDNTMFNGVPGHWRAWKLDSEGHRQHCGIIPSKYKVEEELLLRRSSTDTATARRSFFRRKKHQRSGSRDSKELASFCNLSPAAWYSEHEEATYQRVERLEFAEFRPVLVLGPLAECIQDKLVSDFPDKFARAHSETRRCSQAQLEQEVSDGSLLEYRKRGSCFECTPLNSVRAVGQSHIHCMLDICASTVERLHRQGIFPVVLLLKFKSTKQIRELKDAPRYSPDKLSAKAAKEMFEHGQKLETEYRHLFSAILSAGANVAHICAQVKAAVEQEHARSQWVPVQ